MGDIRKVFDALTARILRTVLREVWSLTSEAASTLKFVAQVFGFDCQQPPFFFGPRGILDRSIIAAPFRSTIPVIMHYKRRNYLDNFKGLAGWRFKKKFGEPMTLLRRELYICIS